MSSGTKMSRETADNYIETIQQIIPNIVPCGSYRRGKDMVGDLDIAAIVDPQADFAALSRLVAEATNATVQRGAQRVQVLVTEHGHQIDLYRTVEEHIGAMVMFLTGSAKHNMKVRAKAKYRGFTLNQYGLYTRDSRDWVAGTTEHSIYDALGLPYVEPGDR